MPRKFFSSSSKLLFLSVNRQEAFFFPDTLLFAGNSKRPLQDNYSGGEGIFQIIFLKAQFSVSVIAEIILSIAEFFYSILFK